MPTFSVVLRRFAELTDGAVGSLRVGHSDQRTFPRRNKVLPISLENHRPPNQSALEVHASAARVNPGLSPPLLSKNVNIQTTAAVLHLQRHPVFTHPASVIHTLDETVCNELAAAGWVNVPTPDPKIKLPVLGTRTVVCRG